MSSGAVSATFYFDLHSPFSYLAGERVLQALPGPAAWQPVLARELPHAQGFESFRCAHEQDALRADVARRARELGLQPLRWPQPFPFDSELAMRAATYAASIGRGVAFAQAAARQAFAAGRDLRRLDNVLIAAAACEMHPRAVKAALARQALADELREASARAAALGVGDVPAVAVAAEVFSGERELDRAALRMSEALAACA